MKYTIAQPFITLGGIKVPISEEAIRIFSRWKLKKLNVIPFERVGKKSWNVITTPPYNHELRENFSSSTNQKIHLVHFVGEDEFKRVLESYFH